MTSRGGRRSPPDPLSLRRLLSCGPQPNLKPERGFDLGSHSVLTDEELEEVKRRASGQLHRPIFEGET